MLDPTCSDLTARMLELLGYVGYSRDLPMVQRAITHLQTTQEDDGSWYGRWGVNYIYGTWQVLRGLRAIGLDMRADWIQRGRDWLESCQNDDGGWGETVATYDDPLLKGQGPSTASQTAWAVMGLIACGDPRAPASSAASNISCARRTRTARGRSRGRPAPVSRACSILRYDIYRNNWPLLALASYLNEKNRVFRPTQVVIDRGRGRARCGYRARGLNPSVRPGPRRRGCRRRAAPGCGCARDRATRASCRSA